MIGPRQLLGRCSARTVGRLHNQGIQLCQHRFASIPTTLDERPGSTGQRLDDIDSFDDMLDSDELTQLYTARPPSAQQQSSPARSTTNELTELQLLRRRDRVTKSLESIGSEIQPFYSPRKLLHSPPDMSSVGIAALAAAQAHMGHSTALWNPMTQPFIYGVRNGIHLFNLEITLEHLRRAAEVIKGVAKADGNIIFVGTRAGQKRAVVEAAARAGGYHIFDRWVPGTITNGKQVVGAGRVKNLVTKHVRNQGAQSLKNPYSVPNSIVPDLVVVLNPLENHILMQECARGRVPTIGIVDSDVDPRLVTYSIPANDDSIRCTTLIAGVLSRAAQAGRAEMQVPDWEQVELAT